jgi:drug/metabolite transporter superfamily protein YnfA
MNNLSRILGDSSTWFTGRRIVEISIMFAAAVFEVGGDAMIRAGLRGYGWLLCGLGVATLGAYGVIVNLLAIDFSKLLAAYVAFFAIVSVAFGKFLFSESVPTATWAGLTVILVGSAIIQLGS